VGRRGLCIEVQLLQLSGSGCDNYHGSSQLDAILLIVQCSFGLGVHGDDAGKPRYLELQVGVAGDDHQLNVT
jgi:hypothetical protein